MTASDCVPTASRTRSLATTSASLPVGDAVADVINAAIGRVDRFFAAASPREPVAARVCVGPDFAIGGGRS
jgi:hypothetical protein